MACCFQHAIAVVGIKRLQMYTFNIITPTFCTTYFDNFDYFPINPAQNMSDTLECLMNKLYLCATRHLFKSNYMKKTLLSLSLIVASLGASAQSFSLGYADEFGQPYTTLADGEEVYVNKLEVVDEGYQYELPAYFQYTNLTSSPLDLTMTISLNTEITSDPAPDFVIQFCNASGCQPSYDTPWNYTLAANTTYGNRGFHLAACIWDSNGDEVDLTSDRYLGTWAADVNVKASNGEEMTATFVFENPTGSVEGIHSDIAAPTEYYNLQGIKVANPTSGLYISKQGDKTRKVVF